MLDSETKRRINSLRDILVGKLPDPKAQVEQITNGLIYKFMNDMDDESVSMGGKASYFSGRFKKYSWKHLLDTKTSGVEKVSLYSEAIEQMYNNENLPELFREIFKNSFLPFKDAATLNMFLKEINHFNYSNSEKLGDAFEYLLSFMGSQGDAGQFRTPRHIIDFIVKIVNPQKNETILDPACGTGGFLISSYKHILNQNTKKNLGDGLTASDRKKIGDNLNGYDISPDMIKMSLVNMYLHKFTNPKINEYDTLSSEDRWNEYYDVILANPPFFSPKGGITPHNRFGVKSSKAEVLFVDYINEHLKPNGRAGIIVPEGIIFQTGTSYKQLRKRLLETSLIGVISLPAGVFQPYSGVKTSILILDKEKNKVRKDIFFIDLKNDGYSLSANRNPIKENDIPIYLEKIKNDFKDLKCFEKKEISKNSDFSFTFKSYFNEGIEKSKFSLVNLTDICELYQPKTITQKELVDDGKYPVYGANGVIGRYNDFNHENSEIAITCRGATCGTINLTKPFSWITGNAMVCKISNPNDLNKKYLFYVLKNSDLSSVITGSAQPQITRQNFNNFKIPLPPIKNQNQIVEELDGYQKIIDGCRQVIENYKPSIDIHPSWEMVEIGEVVELIKRGITPKYVEKNGVIVLNQRCIRSHSILYEFSRNHNQVEKKISVEKYLQNGDVLVNSTGVGTLGRVAQYFGENNKITVDSHLTIVRPKKNIFKDEFFGLSMIMVEDIIAKSGEGSSGQTELSKERLSKIKISFPKSLELQSKICEQIKLEREIVYKNKKLIDLFVQKIQNKINSIWSN